LVVNLEHDTGVFNSLQKMTNFSTYLSQIDFIYHQILDEEITKNDNFNYWQNQFTYHHGRLAGQRAPDIEALASYYGITGQNYQLFPLIFAIQTYYAMTLKLITSRVLGEKVSTEKVAKEHMITLESGQLMIRYGITNFCQFDYYSWYLEVWSEDWRQLVEMIYKGIPAQSVIRKTATDSIKQYYEELFPKALRHPMGEYFTPRWMIQYSVDQLERIIGQDLYEQRFLDPTCGSGSFLIEIIDRLKTRYGDLDHQQRLNTIMQQVRGFELNYISVLAARTQIIIQLIDDIQEVKQIDQIPIYHTDSLLIPVEVENHYIIDHHGQQIKIPTSIVDHNQLREYLKSLARLSQTTEKTTTTGLSRRRVNEIAGDYDIDNFAVALISYFQRITSTNLHQFVIQEIEDRIQPLTTEAEILIGNPPWVGWEYMPKDYRKEVEPLWRQYNLYDAKGIEASNHKEDLSVLMLYRFLDAYLKQDGTLAMVVRANMFKSPQTGKQFRKFELPSNPLEVLEVDDLSSFDAFANAKNNAALLYLRKGQQTIFPVCYRYWIKSNNVVLTDTMSLADMREGVSITKQYAMPIGQEFSSRWIHSSQSNLDIITKLRGKPEYRARIGVFTGGANAVYYLEIKAKLSDDIIKVQNYTKGARRKVNEVTAVIESKLVWPILKGRDLSQWQFSHRLYLLVPHTPHTLMAPLRPAIMRQKYPRTLAYLEQFRESLDRRRGFSWDKKQREKAYYSILRIGSYTFRSYKVAWRYISKRFQCAVIKPIKLAYYQDAISPLPNDKLSFIATDDETEAYYLCGLLSSSPYKFVIEQQMVSTQISPSIINHLYLPRFDPDNNLHQEIADICKQGHQIGKNKEIVQIQQNLDKKVAEFIGLSEIQVANLSEI